MRSAHACVARLHWVQVAQDSSERLSADLSTEPLSKRRQGAPRRGFPPVAPQELRPIRAPPIPPATYGDRPRRLAVHNVTSRAARNVADVPGTAQVLTAAEVRTVQLAAQGLYGQAQKRRPAELLSVVGAVQLDTISVLARSHELVTYARYGPIGRKAVESVLWGGDTFEYWAHAACVLPISDWPVFSWRREGWRQRVDPKDFPAKELKEVRARLAEGPLTANELGGAKAGGPWWDWTHTKRVVELLLATGEVVCMYRKGFQRVYDLAARRIPESLLSAGFEPDECRRQLVERSGRHIGVGTAGDLADYYRLLKRDVLRVVEETCLVQVEVVGWGDKAWAHPFALAVLAAPKARHVTTLLSPFDSLVWDRRRVERVFGFVHRLEAYVPAPKRVHGYYSMPVLSAGRLVARVDPGRRDGALVAKRITLESIAAADAVATALKRAARWVDTTDVIVEQVHPAEAKKRIQSSLG
jgi:uncharacterized protein